MLLRKIKLDRSKPEKVTHNSEKQLSLKNEIINRKFLLDIVEVFGIGKSTVIKIVQDVAREHVELSSNLINFSLTTLEHGTAIKAFSKCTKCSIPIY